MCTFIAIIPRSPTGRAGHKRARPGIIFDMLAAIYIFIIPDVFWRDLAEIRRLKLLSKIEKNGNAPKNEVEDEKMLKNMVRFRN